MRDLFNAQRFYERAQDPNGDLWRKPDRRRRAIYRYFRKSDSARVAVIHLGPSGLDDPKYLDVGNEILLAPLSPHAPCAYCAQRQQQWQGNPSQP